MRLALLKMDFVNDGHQSETAQWPAGWQAAQHARVLFTGRTQQPLGQRP